MTPTSPQNELMNHPSHYTKGGVECIDALDAAVVGKPPDGCYYYKKGENK